jgi:uncharacterized membrane protein
MTLILLCLLIGVVAGLRAMMAPALAAWGAHCCFAASGWPAFMGYRFTPWIFSLFALAELVTDQLPSTPSRKVPPQFGARIVMGGLAGATLASSGGMWIAGLVAGVIGAVIGTLGGAAARAKLATAFGKDLPAALIEDAVAVIGGIAIILAV